MRTTTLAMSAAALLALRGAEAFKTNASGVFGRSLSHLVGGKTCDNPSTKPAGAGKAGTTPALDTTRTGVKRGLFSKLFGGMSEGIDYSTLKGACGLMCWGLWLDRMESQ